MVIEAIIAFPAGRLNPEKFALKHNLSIMATDDMANVVCECLFPYIHKEVDRYQDIGHRIVIFKCVNNAEWKEVLSFFPTDVVVLTEHTVKELPEWYD